ncbi:hypothetical protein, partial [Escherichia coli]|uniref:hypothetical protein n=1 Tax=Escherichia coli TaxID=562 RepID=UPI001BE45FD8
MSATTMAAATQSETVEPLLDASPPGKAAPPASDAAMSVPAIRFDRAGSGQPVQAVLTKAHRYADLRYKNTYI